MTFQLTPALKEHRAGCVEILNQAILNRKNAYTDRLGEKDGVIWFNHLLSSSHLVLVATNISEKVLGWGCYSPYRSGRGALAQCAEITFYVHLDFQRQGIGAAMVDALERHMASNGIRHSIAILLENNTESTALLSSKGYVKWAVLPEIVHFTDATVGHLYMGKNLN